MSTGDVNREALVRCSAWVGEPDKNGAPASTKDGQDGGGVGGVLRIAEGVTLILGDCLQMELPAVDAVISDPPYGIGGWSANSTGGFMTAEEARKTKAWDEVPSAADLLRLAALGTTVFWGGNYLGLPAWRSPLIWDKYQKDMHFAEAEIAWTNFDFGTARILFCPIKQQETFGAKVHPTQKPIRVMSWSIEQARVPFGGVVFDPFMGSGTTAIACLRTGRKFIGVERDPVHFETAVKRVRRELEECVFEFAKRQDGGERQEMLDMEPRSSPTNQAETRRP